MPTNRNKRTRNRADLDDHRLRELFYGPGTCLIAGAGYLAAIGYQRWEEADEDTRKGVIEAMRADWTRQRGFVLAAWEARDEHQRDIAARHYGNPADPWALETFGEPGNE